MKRVVAVWLIIAISLVWTAFASTEKHRLREDLAYAWITSYQAKVCDCDNYATATAAYLQEIKGWDTEVCTDGPYSEGTDGEYHAWVRVRKSEYSHSSFYYMVEASGTSPWIVTQSMTDFDYWSGYTAYEWYEYMQLPWDMNVDLVHKYNRLVDRFNDLRNKYNRLVDKYNSLPCVGP